MTDRQNEAAPTPGEPVGNTPQAPTRGITFTGYSFSPGSWATAVGKITGAAVVIVGVFLVGYLIWDTDWTPETEGTIFVETPQVYTRERLVNDRFVQEAWLRNELDARPTIGSSEAASTTAQREFRVQGNSAAPEGSSRAPAADKGSGGSSEPAAAARLPLGVPPSVDFLLRNAHRELVRAHLIENQLDDRHDIRGTTIYMLKFDASVLPGNNTRKAAFVRVRATQHEAASGSQTGDDLTQQYLKLTGAAARSQTSNDLTQQYLKLTGAASRSQTSDDLTQQYLKLTKEQAPATQPNLAEKLELYNEWLKSLRDRFNSQFSEILHRFNANEFRFSEYYDLIASIDRPTNSQELFYSLTNALAKLQTERDEQLRFTKSARLAGDIAYRFHFVAKYIVYLSREGKSEASFAKLGQWLKDGPPPDLLKGINLEPLRTEIFRYAVRRLGKVVVGDNSLVLGKFQTAKESPLSTAYAHSKTLEHYVTISLNKEKKDDREALEIDVDEKQIRLAAFDSAEVDSIYNNQCGDGKLQELFAKTYTLLTQYEDSGRKLRVFYLNAPESDANPRSILPSQFQRPDKLPKVLHAGFASDAPDPFKACLKFARERSLQVGWLNFMSGILDMQTYTYATFPRYDALVSDTTFDASRAEALSAEFQAAKTSGAISNYFRQVARMVEAKASVVGFSGFCSEQTGAQNRPRGATHQPDFCRNNPGADDLNFGWALYPPTHAGKRYGGSTAYRPMPPTQRSLSALVTVPSHWKRIKLDIDTGWINEDGTFSIGHTYDYKVTLPLDYEALDTILIGPARRDSQRPSVAVERFPEVVEVEACQRAEILIPGRRLWRSTVVVLGGQRANEVVVLPDMRGIIATFYKIAPRSSADTLRMPPPDPADEAKRTPRAGREAAGRTARAGSETAARTRSEGPEEAERTPRAGAEQANEETRTLEEAVTERELQIWTSEGVATALSVLVRGAVGVCPVARSDSTTPSGGGSSETKQDAAKR